MPGRLGDHARRVRELRELLTSKGRRSSDRFLFEGATLLDEAHRSGLPIHDLYATEKAYASTPLLRQLESGGVPLWMLSAKAAQRLSDLESPPGIFAVSPRRLAKLEAILARAGLVLVLADLADPGNAGTLVRAAQAFGASGIVFGTAGVDPYHPKVVRAAMGSLFRTLVSIADPEALQAAVAGRRAIAGLDVAGAIEVTDLPPGGVLVVGQERQGLGPWKGICGTLVRIPMSPQADSLNAAVAGAIALYEASRRALE